MSSFLTDKKNAKTFEQKIEKLSKSTQIGIMYTKNSFDKFCMEYYDGRKSQEIFEELKTLKGKEQTEAVREVLQSWIDWQYTNGNLTNGILSYLSKIKRVFSHNGVKIHPEDFDEPLEFKPKIKEELHELTIEEIQQIFKFANSKKIGYYLALSCTGARPSELLQVRKKDIDATQKRIKIRIEATNTKTSSGRSVWLSKEAASYLMPRLKKLNDNDLVWAKNENTFYAEQNESQQFTKVVKKSGFTDRYKSNRFLQITLYSFRSFFFGKAADVHREGYAHRMTGHGGYLPQYDRMSDEKRLEWFLKLEPELTIDSTVRDKIALEKAKKENTEMEEIIKEKDEALLRLSKVEAYIEREELRKQKSNKPT